MIQAILNLLLMAAALVCVVFWILALGDWDGECHYDDCGHCPYRGTCPEEKRHVSEEK